MKTIVPNYYSSFSCIKDACRHSCCIGWEIGIDEDTLAYYRSLSGDIAQKLSECIDENDEGACFHLDENERCPFLTREGLCELILTLGEDSLCQICADHPRFRSFFSDRTEMGLGLCCEAAAQLILTYPAPAALTAPEDDGEDEMPSEEEADLLALRDRLFAVMQDRSQPVSVRVGKLLTETGTEFHADYAEWKRLLLSLERLDEAWTDCLNLLDEEAEADDAALLSPEWEIAFEQLMVYLIFRHLPDALLGGDVQCEVRYCVLMWSLLRRMLLMKNSPDMEQFIELCRLYSSEIEYSDENLALIHDALYAPDCI